MKNVYIGRLVVAIIIFVLIIFGLFRFMANFLLSTTNYQDDTVVKTEPRDSEMTRDKSRGYDEVQSNRYSQTDQTPMTTEDSQTPSGNNSADNHLNLTLGMPVDDAISQLQSLNIDYELITDYVKFTPSEGLTSIEKADKIIVRRQLPLTTEKVFWLQENLKVAGYYLVIDGSYGDASKEVMDRYSEEQMGETFQFFNSDIEAHLNAFNAERYAGDIANYLVLVNKNYNLHADDVPPNLIDITVRHDGNVSQVDQQTDQQLQLMFDDAKKDGVELRVVSAYRSFQYQVQLFERYAAKHGVEAANMYSALPGQSEHQTGYVVDLDDVAGRYTLTEDFDKTAAFAWLDQNAHRYGFILRYPQDKVAITGYDYEPWHYRYVGDVDVASYIKQNHLTLEEYLGREPKALE